MQDSRNKLTVAHRQRSGGEAIEQRAVVRDDHHRLVDSLQGFRQLFQMGGVETVGRLIKQQNIWVHGEHASQTHHALFAPRETAHEPVRQMAERKGRQRLAGAGERGLVSQPHVEGAERDVFHDCGAEELVVGVLEHVGGLEAHVREVGFRLALAAKGENLALRDGLETDHRAQKCCFACAVRAHDGEAFASR